jgi:ABC-type lipoprotein export system ATPase subunit
MLLQAINISKSFRRDIHGKSQPVLDGLNLDLEKGETISILGPSGSGKSTLLNILGTLDRQDSGDILFDDVSISSYSEQQLTLFRNREIGFIFQLHHLLPQCTVLENILLPVLPVKDKMYRTESRERALHLLREVGLWDLRHRYPDELSGGENQRVAVTRALINKPKLLLADEPTGSLDRENALSIASLLLQLNSEFGTSLIIVTHSVEIGARMGKIYELNKGKLEINRSTK